MAKIILLVLISIATVAISSRDVRSPGGSGWRGSNTFGAARSSGGGGWTNYGGGQGRSAGDGAWREDAAFGSIARSRSGSVSGYRNGRPSNNGWWGNGDGLSSTYGGNSFRSSPGWSASYPDSAVIESLDASSGWNKPDLSFRSNSGWQSSGW